MICVNLSVPSIEIKLGIPSRQDGMVKSSEENDWHESEPILDGHGIEYPQTPIDITFRKAARVTFQASQLEMEGQS